LEWEAKLSKRCLSGLIIEVWLIVRIEADMIVNRINHQPSLHRPPPHHPSLRYHLQHPQLSEFFYEEEYIYQCNDFEDDYVRRRGFTNPNPNRRDGYPNPNRRSRFLSYIRDIGGRCSNPYEFRIPSFDGSQMLSQPYFGSRKLISCLLWNIFSWKIISCFVAHKLKGRTSTWWDRFQNIHLYQGKPPKKTWRRMKRHLQPRSFSLEKKRWRFDLDRSWDLMGRMRQRSHNHNHPLKNSQPREVHHQLTHLQLTISLTTYS